MFGYGSLTAHPGPVATRELKDHGFVADLVGWRRIWGVAMDNRRDLAGYKYYTDVDGRRPDVFVAYPDLVPADPAPAHPAEDLTPEGRTPRVNGLCLPVNDAMLEHLDRRERNYERTDVSDRIARGALDSALGGVRVWAYIGTGPARARLAEGRRTGTAVIDAGYLRTVEAAFAVLGDDELACLRASLAPGDLPVVPLTRHELP